MSILSKHKVINSSSHSSHQFQLVLTLQNDIIDMKLTCEQQMLFFGLKVDQKYLQNNSDMAMLFPDVKSFYFTLERLQEELQVFTNGKVAINIDLKAAKINLKKQYSLEMKNSPLAQLQWLKMKIKQQRKNRQQEQRSREEKISQFQSFILEKQKKIQQSNQQSKKLQAQISKITNQLLIFQQQLQRLQSQLFQSKQVNKKQQRYIEQLQQSIRDQTISYKQSKQQFSISEYQKQRIISSICMFNPHSQHFITKFQPQTIQVTKKCQNGWSNFVSGWPIPQKQITTFRFKQIKTRDGSLGIGIGSQSVFSSLNLQHMEYIAYFCRDGRIYENGLKKMNGSPFVSDSDLIVKINRLEGKIDWISNSTIFGSASIPPSLSTKSLYLILKIFWKQDEFQLYY